MAIKIDKCIIYISRLWQMREGKLYQPQGKIRIQLSFERWRKMLLTRMVGSDAEGVDSALLGIEQHVRNILSPIFVSHIRSDHPPILPCWTRSIIYVLSLPLALYHVAGARAGGRGVELGHGRDEQPRHAAPAAAAVDDRAPAGAPAGGADAPLLRRRVPRVAAGHVDTAHQGQGWAGAQCGWAGGWRGQQPVQVAVAAHGGH